MKGCGVMWTEPAGAVARSVRDDALVTSVDEAERPLDAGGGGGAGRATVSCILCMDSVVGGAQQLQQHLLLASIHTYTHTHTPNGPFSRTTRVSRYQKGKTSVDLSEARDSEWHSG